MANDANRDYLGKALDIAVRLALIAIIVLGAFRVFSPFLATVVWATLIAIALYPVVVFAVFYQLFRAWVADDEAPHKTASDAETT